MRRVQSGQLDGPGGRLGPADLVTGARVLLTAVVVVLFLAGAPPLLVAVPLVVALLSDLVDGQVARRTGTASDFGARFDMEADALLILVLSVMVATDVGWWVLGLGLARYLFAVVVWFTPALQFDPAPRPWCKVVAAIVATVLSVSVVGLLPAAAEVTGLVVTTALLAESFVHEAIDRWRAGARVRPVALTLGGSGG